MWDTMVKTLEFGSFSSGRKIIPDCMISARTIFGLSGASGCVVFSAMAVVVLVASSSNFLIAFTISLCEHGNGSGEYLCNKKGNGRHATTKIKH